MEAVKWDSEAAKARSAGRYFRKMYFREVYSNNNDIMKAGAYETASGRVVTIDNKEMLDGTTVYSIPFVLNGPSGQSDFPRTFAANQDCIDLAKELAAEGLTPAVLNLADARIACGFYYRGSGAQEESLCRRTTLSQSCTSITRRSVQNACQSLSRGKDTRWLCATEESTHLM